MALNPKLRSSVHLVQIADDVAFHGDFSMVGNRFYYTYINRRGHGVILHSWDGGYHWSSYDNLGPVDSLEVRGPWVGWAEGPRAVLYDITQQWRVVDAQPFENVIAVGRVTPLPEIASISYSATRQGASNSAGTIKAVNNFGLWDAPAHSLPSDGLIGFEITYVNTYQGVFGDRQPMGLGRNVVNEIYLYETWHLGSPAASNVRAYRRTNVSAVNPTNVPHGDYLLHGLGVRGMEGTLDSASGVMDSSRRGPPGLGTHNRGIPAGVYSVRMHGEQVGLRNYPDFQGTDFEFTHGGSWVNEQGVIAVRGSIGSHPGVLFCDTAGSITMVKRSGSRFGAWSEAKSYGNPGVAPSKLWVPHTYGDLRAGIMGGPGAWFMIDPTPDFIPRGRLVAGDYLPPLRPNSKVRPDLRKVTFW